MNNITELDNEAYNLYLLDNDYNFSYSQKQIKLYIDFGYFLNNKKVYCKYYKDAKFKLRKDKIKRIL